MKFNLDKEMLSLTLIENDDDNDIGFFLIQS